MSDGTKFVCSISGEECKDAVVTPSGHICERRLLLSKLVDTGGTDPFRPNVILNESDLVTLQLPKDAYDNVPPPRLETATSFSQLLQLMQREHDALLLELYDTRKALEETRMELSQALYQTDAAVRVIARLSMERDQAKQDLINFKPTPDAPVAMVQNEEEQPPSCHDPQPEAMQVEPEEPKKEESFAIPEDDLNVMIEAWQKLSAERKARKKQKDAPTLSPEDLAKFQALDSKSLHKSNKPGVTAISSGGSLVASAGKDKHVIVYSRAKDQIVNSISMPSSSGTLTCVDLALVNNPKSSLMQTLVVTGDTAGVIRCFAEFPDPDDSTATVMKAFGDVKGGLGLSDEKENVVDVTFHPTGHYVLASTANGNVVMVKLQQPLDDGAEGTMEILNKLSALDQSELEKGTKVTSSALHPDGLIYLVGLSTGAIQVWDLKTQALASTLMVRLHFYRFLTIYCLLLTNERITSLLTGTQGCSYVVIVQ